MSKKKTSKKATKAPKATVRNAVIASTFLGRSDGANCRTAFVQVQLDGNQRAAFGGVPIMPDDRSKDDAEAIVENMQFIFRLCDAVGVKNWESLSGSPCRVEIDKKGRVVALGSFMGSQWLRLG